MFTWEREPAAIKQSAKRALMRHCTHSRNSVAVKRSPVSFVVRGMGSLGDRGKWPVVVVHWLVWFGWGGHWGEKGRVGG